MTESTKSDLLIVFKSASVGPLINVNDELLQPLKEVQQIHELRNHLSIHPHDEKKVTNANTL